MKSITYDDEKWQLVPIDATKEMVDKTLRVDLSNEDERAIAINLWQIMLAVAPPPPVVEVEPVAYLSGHLRYAIEKTGGFIPMAVEVSLVNLNWKDQIPLYTAPPDVEALRQRVKELLQMITDQDYEYNRKTNALIKRHADQLATQAEQINGVVTALPGQRYMDPPDGGDVSLGEQVARMWQEVKDQAEQIKTAIDAMQKAADVFEFYARHHATKNPIDDAKAVRNYAHRNDLRIAIAKLEVK